ncbi:Ty3/gypsy retrotransposon protein [Cucumis melo var. makuwa]|uniref:Ty3/gypsy retrotransposon protein n=1 Tax=Cucumis melo var. makuwa TaxID=1194695 RepID=A0A5D3D1B8_CUCMM|nr:Ty3/gypsy retrotransposon protein [Cucumis melo var. makuwa]
MKLKDKMEEMDVTVEMNTTTVDKKLEMPMFLGENLESWVYRAEHFLEINNLPEAEKVKVAVVSFEQDEDGSYNDYVKKFVNYSAPLPYMAESVLRDAFVIGLELALQAKVISRHPQTLEECMKEAQLVNDRNLALKLARVELGIPEPKGGESSTTKIQAGNEKGMQRKTEFQMKQVTIPIKGNYQKRDPPVKRLSNVEFRARLDRGLCCRCNEKYSHGHCCKKEEKVELKQLDITEGAEVEFKAITGFTSKGTMQLKGHVKDKEVIVLIDSGATHNFIHQALVDEKKILIEEGTPLGVTIGDGTRYKGKRICRKVELRLNELTIVADFLTVVLGKVDVVLGMQWLDTTKNNEGSLTILNYKKILELEDQGFLLEWKNYELEAEDDCEKEQETKGEEEELPMIKFLLARYADISETPKGLPPKRAIDHHILTLLKQRPINVRPYKYSHVQKEEIEKLAVEMLQTGVIRPSHSPYSSPILLVKKKDGGWRFCVDYRKLNQATTSDKFPIPVIEEPFDELHRPTVFSKMDFKSGYHQIKMREDIEKTAFRTHNGHYEFLVIPFGLTNAPTTFQSLMNQWPQPTDVTGSRGFLGLISYYKRFVKGYGEIAAPLTKLLQKNSFKWDEEAIVAFENLKLVMTTIPMLALPDWFLPFIIETDALGIGLRAVLSQNGHPYSIL